jgi:osmotically-inducible protein OsmY
MTTREKTSDHTIARLREALATDERTNVLDVSIRLRSEVVHLSGQVDTEERRRLIEEVVRENLPPEHTIHNQLTVARMGAPEIENVE